MKSSELVRLLEKDGWYLVRSAGSHHIYRHPTEPGQLVIPVHAAKEVKKGLLSKILKAAQIKTPKR